MGKPKSLSLGDVPSFIVDRSGFLLLVSVLKLSAVCSVAAVSDAQTNEVAGIPEEEHCFVPGSSSSLPCAGSLLQVRSNIRQHPGHPAEAAADLGSTLEAVAFLKEAGQCILQNSGDTGGWCWGEFKADRCETECLNYTPCVAAQWDPASDACLLFHSAAHAPEDCPAGYLRMAGLGQGTAYFGNITWSDYKKKLTGYEVQCYIKQVYVPAKSSISTVATRANSTKTMNDSEAEADSASKAEPDLLQMGCHRVFMAYLSLMESVRKETVLPVILSILVLLICFVGAVVHSRDASASTHEAGARMGDPSFQQLSAPSTKDQAQRARSHSPVRSALPSQYQAFRTPTQSSTSLAVPPSMKQPPSPPPLPRQQPRTSEVLPMDISGHLCPGLVVPQGNECVLAVPIVSRSSSRDMVPLKVQDLEGKPVIQAECLTSLDMTQRPLVVLRAGAAPRLSMQSPPLLAYCRSAQEVGGNRTVYVYDSRDQVFAQIHRDTANGRYVLTVNRSGLQLYFKGDLWNHTVIVTNSQNQVLAETAPSPMAFDPTGSFYKLKVGPNVDVGVVLCALLSLYMVECH
jgi:hypothetical protein